MHITFDNRINRTNTISYPIHSSIVATNKPVFKTSNSITFGTQPVVTKTITSQIAHEKTKLLKQIKDVLSTEVPVLSKEEKAFEKIRRALKIFKIRMQRKEEIEKEAKMLLKANHMSPQLKAERAGQLKKEMNRLANLKITDIPEKQPSKDNFDYSLINKFKSAVMEDNFDLAKVQEDHYQDLEKIETVEEFKSKYPSIRIPQNPKDVIINKILDTFNRDFYLAIDTLVEERDDEKLSDFLIGYFENYFKQLTPQLKDKNSDYLMNTVAIHLTQRVFEIYEGHKIREDFDTIPKVRKHSIAQLNENDKNLFNIDYDSFVISTLKKLYLEGQKLNQIEYTEGNTTFNVSSIKSPEYKFEKIPEKIKKIITDAKKAASLQRDYQKFTMQELKYRLNYYTGTNLSENEDIFEEILNFDCCRFTEEDRQYLIKFLQILDKISDGELSIDEGLEIIKTNNIRPHGTNKLNEIERKEAEQKLKQEQQKNLELNQIREHFNRTLNKLYELNLPSIAEEFSRFYPEVWNEKTMTEAVSVIETVQKYLALKEPKKIKNAILRWETFKEYNETLSDSNVFQEALNYAKFFNQNELEQRSGQYLINREIIDNYPSTANLIQNPAVLEKIMDRFGYNPDLATIYLCKYEDYSALEKNEKNSILKILNIFDAKNVNDKILLKHIIENDYINSNTEFNNLEIGQKTTITPSAKQAILDKYKFPECIDLFIAFEEAMTLKATESGSAGIKQIGRNNEALQYKIEAKIKGYTDRLFSSKNDYIFNVYSEKGLH